MPVSVTRLKIASSSAAAGRCVTECAEQVHALCTQNNLSKLLSVLSLGFMSQKQSARLLSPVRDGA